MVTIENLVRPIVIVGCQRSGTTLLRTILGQHPQLLEHPKEPQFILEMYQRFGYEVRDVKTAVAYLLKHPYLPDGINREALNQAYAPYTKLSLATFFQIYLQVWAGDELQSRRPVLKDPALVYHLDLVAKLFPQATILHVVRDPRGTVSSQKTRWQQYTTWECTMLWKRALQSTFYWGKKNKESLVEIGYERVLRNPQEEIASLCGRLGIPFRPEMLTFEEKTLDFIPNGPPERITFKTVDASRLHQWQERLTLVDIRMIESACLLEMNQWGYELTYPAVSNRHFYSQLAYERLYFFYKINGRRARYYFRKMGWRFSIGLLKVPAKELEQAKTNPMDDQRKYWQSSASPLKLRYLDQYATGQTALDVGCGAGHYGRALRQKGFQVVGLDLEPRPEIDFPCFQARLQALPLSKSFDTVLAFDVLEHEANETQALSELSRVTGNRLILSVPNADDHLLTRYNLTYKHHIDKTHFREYTLEEIGQKLKSCGFHIVEINKEGPVSPAILAEFVPGWLQGVTRIFIKGLHRLHLLQNAQIMADIYVVAERKS